MRYKAILTAALLVALCVTAKAEVYRVGPGEKVQKISAIIDSVAPGDVIEVTGDISDSFITRKHGTAEKPIVIRGAEGKRPKIDFARAKNGIETRARLLHVREPRVRQRLLPGHLPDLPCDRRPQLLLPRQPQRHHGRGSDQYRRHHDRGMRVLP